MKLISPEIEPSQVDTSKTTKLKYLQGCAKMVALFTVILI